MGSTSLPFQVQDIAIIGAGPCGLSAAKYLLAQGFRSITIFEQQDEVGGTWYYSERPVNSPRVPQTNPFAPPDAPLPPRYGSDALVFPSPMYETLHANIFGSLMNFSGFKFPDDSWIFPSRQVIQEYLVEYAKDVRHLIKFCCSVESLELVDRDGRDQWIIETKSTLNDSSNVERGIYDAVVVANGHYSLSRIPAIARIEDFHKAHPEVIIHSKQYRSAKFFAGKRVVIVGNGPSGLDVAYQVSKECARPLLLSVRTPTPPAKLEHASCDEIAEIEEFLPESRGIRLVDGKVIKNLDAVVFCTGYLYSLPFVKEPLASELITVGRGVHGLYKHTFCIDHPTLVFPGLNMRAVPFPVSEAQAAVTAAVWANALALPPVEDMKRWEAELYKEKGESLHVLDPLADGKLINEMHDWVTNDASSKGKEPPYWNDELMWRRSIYAEAKLRFEQEGGTTKSLEELGYVYPGPSWKDKGVNKPLEDKAV